MHAGVMSSLFKINVDHHKSHLILTEHLSQSVGHCEIGLLLIFANCLLIPPTCSSPLHPSAQSPSMYVSLSAHS